MKKIYLTNGGYALVDDEDYDSLVGLPWYRDAEGYARRELPHKDGKRSGSMKMHRQILEAKQGELVDHGNRNKLDNRRENIKIVSRSHNNVNVAVRKDNASGYKGVAMEKQSGKWRVQISVAGKVKTVGRFSCRHEAARAYNAAALQYHGEHAYQNIIEEETE